MNRELQRVGSVGLYGIDRQASWRRQPAWRSPSSAAVGERPAAVAGARRRRPGRRRRSELDQDAGDRLVRHQGQAGVADRDRRRARRLRRRARVVLARLDAGGWRSPGRRCSGCRRLRLAEQPAPGAVVGGGAEPRSAGSWRRWRCSPSDTRCSRPSASRSTQPERTSLTNSRRSIDRRRFLVATGATAAGAARRRHVSGRRAGDAARTSPHQRRDAARCHALPGSCRRSSVAPRPASPARRRSSPRTPTSTGSTPPSPCPQVSVDSWRLDITGMVDRQLTLSYDELIVATDRRGRHHARRASRTRSAAS